ncbi:MAG: endonuclease III [Prevotellaceae bacterium]|jgi:endonuclease-3|nr:endonuclease III [Prevotellaceae bacterium]
MKRKERYEKIIDWFQKNMSVAESELHYGNPYELLVAVILSAQCTDIRVNIVTPDFFKKYPNSKLLAKANSEDVFELIRSISYPNSKTKHLTAMAQMLENDFGGTVPDNVSDLQKLPGVGIKTANVVASIVYGKPVIAVDTHVFRVSHRTGLADESDKTPEKVEKKLEKNIPEKLRAVSHHWLILHGRYVCTARSPHCYDCGINKYCQYFENNFQMKIND